MANNRGNDITLRIGVKGDDVEKTLKEIDATVRRMGDGISDVARKMTQTGSAFSSLQQNAGKPFNNIQQEALKAGKSIGFTRQEAQTLVYTFNDVTASLASGIPIYTILFQQGGQVTQAFGGLSNTLGKLLPYAIRLAPALAAVGASVFAAYEAFSGISAARESVDAIVDLGESAKKAGIEFSDFQRLISPAGSNADKLAAGIVKITEELDRFKKQMSDEGWEKARSKIFETLGIDRFVNSSTKATDVIERLRTKYQELNDEGKRRNFISAVESAFGPDLASNIQKSTEYINTFSKVLDRLVPPLDRADLKAAQTAQTFEKLLAAARERRDIQFAATWVPALQELDLYLIKTFSGNLPLVNDLAEAVRGFFSILNRSQGFEKVEQQQPVIARLAEGYRLLSSAAAEAASAIGSVFSAIANNAAAATALLAGLAFAVGGLPGALAVIGAAFARLLLDIPAVAAAASQLWDSIKAGADAAWTYVVDSLRMKFEQVINDIRAMWDTLKQTFSDTFSGIGSALGFSGGGAVSRATGGYVSGPGSATSDSIPAWLSNGEYVIRAAAVRKLGVGFLNRLNGMTLDPTALGGRFGYASGGLVMAPAGMSGTTSAGRSFSLVIDGRSFNGLTGQGDTVAALEKYAALRQLSSTSKRAPSRIG